MQQEGEDGPLDRPEGRGRLMRMRCAVSARTPPPPPPPPPACFRPVLSASGARKPSVGLGRRPLAGTGSGPRASRGSRRPTRQQPAVVPGGGGRAAACEPGPRPEGAAP